MHQTITPAILYLGTPVVLVSTVNENCSYNLAPMSSAFWLGWRCMLGFEGVSKTPQNLIRTGECVLNLPSDAQVDAVNRLAYLTGSNPVPAGKAKRNYRFEEDKFGAAGLTPVASETVAAVRALKVHPIQLEAKFVRVNPVMADEYDYSVHERSGECTLEGIACIEDGITRVHESLCLDGRGCRRIDPNRWKPLIMSFQRFYGLGPEISESPRGDFRGDVPRPPTSTAKMPPSLELKRI